MTTYIGGFFDTLWPEIIRPAVGILYQMLRDARCRVRNFREPLIRVYPKIGESWEREIFPIQSQTVYSEVPQM